jgi:diguanylate cyclase (GGDEF)-like protein/PAS domain S-box-containing protein
MITGARRKRPEEMPVVVPGKPPVAVLVVDDDASKRLAFRAMLAPLGLEIVEAESGRAALRAVLRQNFAVILMDVRMPVMDGYETAKLIRHPSHAGLTPIIFVTSYGSDEVETADAYAIGAVDFIFTPIQPAVVRAKVSAFVDLFVQSQELQQSLASITSLNASLRSSEALARSLVQNVADGIVTAGESGLIESFNRSARRLFGYCDDEVVGQPLDMLIASSHLEEFSDRTGPPWNMPGDTETPAEPTETVGRRKDGSCFPMEVDVSQISIAQRTYPLVCVRDISGRKAYIEALEYRSLHDDVTGLPNRALFGERMDRAIAAADPTADPRGVLLIDLDEFRQVNDTLGRESGDALLLGVAERLRDAARDSDTVARLEGDEFGILLSGNTDVETAEGIAWKIREAFVQPFVVDDHILDVRASIGIAFFPQHGRATADVLRRADLAMNQAKRSGSGLGVFIAEPEDQTARRLTLLSELRDGIARGELVLHFQPKVELLPTPHTTAVEALVRWQHPTEGLLMPDRFMPEVERSGLIEPLTNWVLEAALHQQRTWRDAGVDLAMAVNISARSLGGGSDLPDVVARLTEEWGIAPSRLILELTEDALIDADVPDVLDLLHAMGVRLAIDDFGTGHSSLVYLQRLPIDQIKIDRSFVMNLASAPSDAVIVRSTIDLAHNLGLTVVAEGVEDEVALGMLGEYACDSAQGYLFSRPCAPDELTRWLADSPYGAQAELEAVRG